ncbi:hypothetical protein ISN72_10935 [Dyella nitratireducens]
MPARIAGLLLLLLSGFSSAAFAVNVTDHWDVGGAVRFRADQESRRNIHNIGIDTVMLSTAYKSDSWMGAASYRWYGAQYPYHYTEHFGDIQFLQYAWIGYKFNAERELHVGLNKVPFGLQPLYSSSFWETLGNLIGMEDVYMVGVKYMQSLGDWHLQTGYYARPMWPGQGTSNGTTYSVVVTPADPGVVGGNRNQERNLFVGRLARDFVLGDWKSEAGVSVLGSDLYNDDTHRNGRRYSYALHYAGQKDGWGTKLQYARQDMAPKNPDGEQVITVGGYDGTFNMATRGNLYVGDLSYRLADSYFGGWLSNVKFYGMYSMYEKSNPDFRNSQRFTLGTSFSVKPLSIYIEWLNGRNDPYIGGSSYTQSLAAGGFDRWRSKLYMNIAYYF